MTAVALKSVIFQSSAAPRPKSIFNLRLFSKVAVDSPPYPTIHEVSQHEVS